MHHPEVVGREFAKQYYFILNRSPENLFRFYKDAAQYDHDAIDVNASQPVTTTGRKGIRKAIEKRCAKHTFRFARLHSVQALASLSDSVIVLVMGEISYDNAPMRPFSQTFMLVSDSPFRYFVANDIFRYTDYVIDDELDESNDSNQLSDSSFINDSGDGRTDVRVDDIVRDVQSMNLKGIILKDSHPLTRKSLLKSVATAPPAPEKPSWSDEMEASEEQSKSQNQMFQDQCILSIGDRINPNIRFDDAKETMCDGTPSTLDQTEMLSSRSDEFSPKMPSTSSCDDYIVEDYNVDECVQLGPYKGGDLQDYQHQDIVMQMHPIPHNMGSIFMYAPMTPLSYTMHPYMESWMTTGHPGATIEEELTESTEATPSFEASLSYSNVTTSTQSNEENSSHSMPAAKSPKRRNSKSRRTIDRATATDTPKSGVQQTAAGVQVDFDPKPAHSTVKSTAVQCGSPAVKKLPTASSRKSTGPPMAILASKPIIVNLTTSEEPSPPPVKCPIAPTQSFAPPPPSPASPTATATPPTATYADLVKNPTVTTDDGDKPELEAPPPRQYNSATFSRSEKPRLQRGTSIRNDREKQQKGSSRGNRFFKDDSHQVFVGNIPHGATDEAIRNIFERFGFITRFRIHSNPDKHWIPRYAFVSYETLDAVRACLKKRDTFYYPENASNGQKLNVNGDESLLEFTETPAGRPHEKSLPYNGNTSISNNPGHDHQTGGKRERNRRGSKASHEF